MGVRLPKRVVLFITSGMLICGNVMLYYSGTAHADALIPVTGTIIGPGGERLGANMIITATSVTTGEVFSDNDGSGYLSTNHQSVSDLSAARFRDSTPGAYELDLPADTYNVYFDDSTPGGVWGDTTINNVVVAGPTTVNATVVPTVDTYNVSGTLTDAQDNPIPDMWIQAAGVGPFVAVKTDVNGNYTMALPPNDVSGWNLTVYGGPSATFDAPQQFALPYDQTLSMDSDTTADIQTPPTGTITAYVTDKLGNPDPGQVVEALGDYPTMIDSVLTDSTGIATLTVWQGQGIGSLCAYYNTDNLRDCTSSYDGDTPEFDEVNGKPIYLAVAPISISTDSVLTNQAATFSSTFVEPTILKPSRRVHLVTWDWGDGSSADTQRFSGNNGTVDFSYAHTYAEAGTYTIELTVATMDGTSATTTLQVSVTD